ncbi:F0F1 ATP synthase subunit delta [Desulfofustis glycolicus]|uniref:ATP synthase subunit b n=1 Tax=Desulfofustis glycolicus DSM 9705 TaxID=1121409 RepID=A0A1M5SJ57_9BACT|nr:F0F1 ATP synthase subunit delta [Desulfofustis glycolicus]MCB2215776.1 F0F1 ATP synthase subunit delta [Desulfobulbaceae bacterium]SHH38627.1 F-type H+-transporting ATPase subunit b [Desulfofustis glycolicus DSM 9705]
MLVDWFTVFAQIANFLILMVLLKIFMYDRIISVMEKRQESIDEELRQAAENREKAKTEGDALASERRELEKNRERLNAEARKEAKKRREQELEDVRAEIQALRKRWHDDLAREKQSFFHDLRKLVGREMVAIGRRFFSDLGEEQLERRLVDRFITRLADLKDQEIERFLATLDENQHRVTVRSAFPLGEQERRDLEREYEQAFGQRDDFQYENTPEVILGIELETGGVKISLTLAHYLASLEERLVSLLAETQPEDTDQPDENTEERVDA